MRRTAHFVAICAWIEMALVGCTHAPDVMTTSAVDPSPHHGVYEEVIRQERVPTFDEVVLKGSIEATWPSQDVAESSGDAIAVRSPRESASHYDALAVMDEIVNRHAKEDRFYQNAVCDRCL